MNTVAPFPDQNVLRQEYEKYSKARALTTSDLEAVVEAAVAGLGSRPTVKGRPKEFVSYFKKYLRLLQDKKGSGSVVITDLIGIRVVCPFLENLDAAVRLLKEKFEVIEVEKKGSNYSFKEFGYESTHLLIKIPADIVKKRGYSGSEVAEIQIRTILQDAWAEVEHELVYKAAFTPLTSPSSGNSPPSMPA
jgi:putative GTP pyrophosphokinase